MSNCIAAIQDIFAKQLLLSDVSPSTELLDSGILDSMRLVELLFHLEQRFGYSPNLADLDLGNLRSIESIADLVAAPLPATATGSEVHA